MPALPYEENGNHPCMGHWKDGRLKLGWVGSFQGYGLNCESKIGLGCGRNVNYQDHMRCMRCTWFGELGPHELL